MNKFWHRILKKFYGSLLAWTDLIGLSGSVQYIPAVTFCFVSFFECNIIVMFAEGATKFCRNRHSGVDQLTLTLVHLWNSESSFSQLTWLQCRFSLYLLSGNSLRQTVHTHCDSVHQAAKLAAALFRVAGVTAGLAESNGSQPPGFWLTSPAGWLPRTGISSLEPYARQLSMGYLYLSPIIDRLSVYMSVLKGKQLELSHQSLWKYSPWQAVCMHWSWGEKVKGMGWGPCLSGRVVWFCMLIWLLNLLVRFVGWFSSVLYMINVYCCDVQLYSRRYRQSHKTCWLTSRQWKILHWMMYVRVHSFELFACLRILTVNSLVSNCLKNCLQCFDTVGYVSGRASSM